MDLPWDGAAKLLSAGPLGLGAILILVTGGILAQKHTIEKGRLALGLGMLVSGVLLTLAGFAVLYFQIKTEFRKVEIAANAATDTLNAARVKAESVAASEHTVHFQVYPNDLGRTHTLPPPIIRVNNEELGDPADYKVKSEVTVIIDVSDAINEAQQYKTANARQAEAINIQANALESATEASKKIPNLLVSSCPGDNRNFDPSNTNEIVLLNSTTIRALNQAKFSTENILNELDTVQRQQDSEIVRANTRLRP